jgi:1-acyl-sn-glycerol-3-phosphate acyltransferase
MIYFIAKFLYWLAGWKLDNNMPKDIRRCVMVASPHTSNWDLYYARLAFVLMNIPVRFTVKKEWLRFPFNLFMKPLGAIGIDRSPKTGNTERKSMVEAMADLFKDRDELVVLVTPEGTRSLATKWKSGFYYVALKAGVPIALGFLDYANKVAGVGKVVYPTGDYNKDMREIMEFYKDIKGRYPEKFSVDLEVMASAKE